MKREIYRGGTDKPELVEVEDMPDEPRAKEDRVKAAFEAHGLTLDDVREILGITKAGRDSPSRGGVL